jgi:hypothetical protein
MIEQLRMTRIQQRQQIEVNRLGCRALLVANTVLRERFDRPFARVTITPRDNDTIALQQRAELGNHGVGTERWPHLPNRVEPQ